MDAPPVKDTRLKIAASAYARLSLAIALLALCLAFGGGLALAAEQDDPNGTQYIGFTQADGAQGYFYRKNNEAGNILILTGIVRNNYSEPRSFIYLRGHLLSSDGKTLADRFAYAGNRLSEEALTSLPIKEITARLSVKSGNDNVNVNIPPGAEVPFMVVFDNVPDGTDQYRIDAISSEPGAVDPSKPVTAKAKHSMMSGTSSGDPDIGFLEDRLSYFYRTNKEAGTILILTGLVRNNYSEPRSFIRLQGHLLAADGSSLVDRFAYAGNQLSEEELTTLPVNEIVARLLAKNGKENANVNIPPGKEIPFMIMFDNLPAGIDEYRVDAVSSEAAQ
ncbi:MAG: DUF3426 domain-containing protein [Candidatus Adiutrix sp.]|jgi:hypothetical protein|nr:DUF3426 domain-containing protein [Candidatus Adiutrix sp.]